METRLSIAVLVWQFPVLSETFILNQITGLIDRGHNVDIYGLGACPPRPSKVHPDVENYGLLDRVVYIPWVPSNYLVRVLRAVKLLALGLRKDPMVMLRFLNIPRYGKHAASLRLLYGALLFLGRKPYDIIHCQFGPLGLEAAFLRDIGALKGKLVTSFRGYDISRYVKQHGGQIYGDLFARGDLFLPNCLTASVSISRLDACARASESKSSPLPAWCKRKASNTAFAPSPAWRAPGAMSSSKLSATDRCGPTSKSSSLASTCKASSSFVARRTSRKSLTL
jgi:hypothetical protein